MVCWLPLYLFPEHYCHHTRGLPFNYWRSQAGTSTHYIKCCILDTKTVPGPFVEYIPKYDGLAHAMCCNWEFPVWKMSSKGKPRERVNSMEWIAWSLENEWIAWRLWVAMHWTEALTLPGASRRGGEGRTCLKKQTHVGLKSCQEAEKTQGSTQRKLNDIEKYINKNKLKKILLSLSYLPGPPQVCKLVHSTLLGVCF